VEGEFGGAEEAEGDAHGAEAGIDVEVDVANAVVAEDVFVTEVGGFDGADEGGADLAAVGVSGELDGGEVLGGEAIGGVGFVEEEDVGFGGVPVAEGGFGIGVASPSGVETGNPEGATRGLEADGFVDEGADAELLEVGGDPAGALPDVVIAEAGEDAEWGLQGGEGAGGGQELVSAGGDEVAGEDDDLGLGFVGELDGAFEGDGGSPVIDVEVGEVENGDAALGFLEVGAGELGAIEDGAAAFPASGVGGSAGAEREGGGGEGLKEAASGEGGHEGKLKQLNDHFSF
jgi:hypothetical protein